MIFSNSGIKMTIFQIFSSSVISDLENISDHAEGIFGSSEECAVLDLDGTGGKTFLRVLLHLGMHDYPPLGKKHALKKYDQ